MTTLIKYIAGTVKGGKYGIKEVTYTRLKEEDGKVKCEISGEEIEQFKAVEVVNKTEQFYKDVFLLMLATGQRISDTCSLIKGNYSVAKDGVIVLPTQKCNTTAYIQPTHDVLEALESIKKYKNIKEKSVTVNINGMIKRLFERAGLNRLTDNKLELYKEVTSHYARHTFATKMLRDGYNCAQVGRMIGDSAAMIEKVYGHPTHDDVINQTFNTHQPTVKSADEEIKEVLIMLGVDTLDVDAMDNVTAWEELTRKHNELFNMG